MENKIALLVVDYQIDFVSRDLGALYVPRAEKLAPKIEALSKLYPLVVLTQDWHAPDDPSFRDWPAHCVTGSIGALISGLIPQTNMRAMAIFRKRKNSALADDKGLVAYLAAHEVTEVHVCGVALDHCVKETAIDLAKLGFKVAVLLRVTKAVDDFKVTNIFKEFDLHGVMVI